MKYPGAGIPAMERAAGLNDDNCYRFMGLYRNLIWTKEYMDFLSREEADSAAEGEADAAGAEAGKGFAAEAAIGRIVLPDAQWTICQSRNGAAWRQREDITESPTITMTWAVSSI